MKAESAGSVEEPGKEPASVQQEARTCPVCSTKFYATADSGLCPVCILRGAASGESSATGGTGFRIWVSTQPWGYGRYVAGSAI